MDEVYDIDGEGMYGSTNGIICPTMNVTSVIVDRANGIGGGNDGLRVAPASIPASTSSVT